MTRKATFFEGWSWFKFNNLELSQVITLKFYISVVKGLKLKVGKFWALNFMFVKFTGNKLVGGLFGTPILNRVKIRIVFNKGISKESCIVFKRFLKPSTLIETLDKAYRKRNVDAISHFHVRKKCFLKCIFPSTISRWNNLHPSIKNYSSLNILKRNESDLIRPIRKSTFERTFS